MIHNYYTACLTDRFKLLGKGAVRDGDRIDGTAVVYILSGKGSQYTQVAHLSDCSLKFGYVCSLTKLNEPNLCMHTYLHEVYVHAAI